MSCDKNSARVHLHVCPLLIDSFKMLDATVEQRVTDFCFVALACLKKNFFLNLMEVVGEWFLQYHE